MNNNLTTAIENLKCTVAKEIVAVTKQKSLTKKEKFKRLSELGQQFYKALEIDVKPLLNDIDLSAGSFWSEDDE